MSILTYLVNGCHGDLCLECFVLKRAAEGATHLLVYCPVEDVDLWVGRWVGG